MGTRTANQPEVGPTGRPERIIPAPAKLEPVSYTHLDVYKRQGKLIPAGTGLGVYRDVDVEATEEAKAERYPSRLFATDSGFDENDLSFVDYDTFTAEEFNPSDYS